MPHNARITRSITMILAAFILALIALSSIGALDKLAKDRVKETRNESAGIYLLSRSINAAVSLAQTTKIGELLDPINDAAERLSSAMAWAIGSLFLQEIVLEVTSNFIFKWSFFAIGLVTIPALLLGRYSDLLVRIFIVAAIFRFIVPAFVIISLLLSQIFLLDTKIGNHRNKLSLFEAPDSSKTSVELFDEQRLHKQKARKEPELARLKKSLPSFQQEAKNQDKKIDQLNEKISWGQWVQGWVPEFFGGAPRQKELVSLKEKRGEINQKIEGIQERIHAINDEIECINRRLAGENCDSLLSKLSAIPSAIIPDAIKTFFTGITEFPDNADEIVTSLTYLLIAILIKNILLPLIFLMITVKCSLPIVRRLASGFKRDLKDLQGYLERGD